MVRIGGKVGRQEQNTGALQKAIFWGDIGGKEGFPGCSDSKESACNAGDLGSIPGSERSPGEGNGNPLQYSCLENSMGTGAWWATVLGGHKELDITEGLTLLLIEGLSYVNTGKVLKTRHGMS